MRLISRIAVMTEGIIVSRFDVNYGPAKSGIIYMDFSVLRGKMPSDFLQVFLSHFH